jgi:hypothetical protein
MAATNGTMLGQFFGPSLLAAFTNPTKYDILQLVQVPGYKKVISVSYNGVVNLNPATAANGSGGSGIETKKETILGQFDCLNGATLSTVAQCFAAAFPTNSSNLDIFQIINEGGNVSYWLDYLGVAHGA